MIFTRSLYSPAVLVPCFDLCVGEAERCCQLHPVLHAQILLTLEAALELRQLVISERSAGFTRLLQPGAGAVSTAGDFAISLVFH